MRKLLSVVGVALVLAVFVPPAGANEISINADVHWQNPDDPLENFDAFISRGDNDRDRIWVLLSSQGHTEFADGAFGTLEWEDPLGQEPCPANPPIQCSYGWLTHDHMTSAEFYMVARPWYYHVQQADGQFRSRQGSLKVWISWTGTGTVHKTINPDGTVTRTRDAVIDLRATFKGIPLVDVTGVTGSFPSVTRDSF